MPKVSVCMAIKDGEVFLRDQLASILPQLAGDDEVVISDDHSSDESLSIIQDFKDGRIRVIQNSGNGVVSNFENALNNARGRYIFLADQDDVWLPGKVSTTLCHLEKYDLVVCDTVIVDENLEPTKNSFYRLNGSGKGIVKNLLRNSYMGCCMAFRASVLEKALPFPKKIPMHDVWIGLVGEIFFKVSFVDQPLVYHRRHSRNASTTSERSEASMVQKISKRLWLMRKVIELKYAT